MLKVHQHKPSAEPKTFHHREVIGYFSIDEYKEYKPSDRRARVHSKVLSTWHSPPNPESPP